MSSPALSEIAQRLKATAEQGGAEAAVANRALRRLFALARQAEAGARVMKIRAIRLKEVGRFSAPVALEGLSGGLDVLAGPNEFGKSTILKAVNAALFEQHRSKHRKLEAFRPYAGGAPLIEVDFEIDGKSWRIRKQFLSSPAAELRDLQSGSVTRGVDAEARLAELLGGAGHFALLCVDQGTPLAAMTPVETGGAAFMAAIESEVESVADGSAARFVAERVQGAAGRSRHRPQSRRARRASTSRRSTSATGSRRRAAEAQTAARARAGAARRAGDAARAGLASLPTPKPCRRASTRPTRRGARSRKRARRARSARAAEQAVASCEKQLGALKAGARRLRPARRRTAPSCRPRSDDAAPLLADAEARAGALKARVVESRKARDALKRALAALERSRRMLELSERLRGGAPRGGTRCTGRARMNDALAGNAAEGKLVDAARREAASIAALEARLSAAAPRVSLSYLPGGAGKIKVDGRALADGETLHPTQPVTLDIEGVGTHHHRAGAVERRRQTTRPILAAHREQLAALLKRAGADSLDDAERLLVARREIEAQARRRRRRSSKSSAPEGIERLQRAHAELAAQAAALGAPAAAIARRIGDARQRAGGNAGRRRGERLTSPCARSGRRTRSWSACARASPATPSRSTGLMAELGRRRRRPRRARHKPAAVNEAQAALNAAVRDGAAWREKAPADARFAELKSRRGGGRGCVPTRERRACRACAAREAGLEGELQFRPRRRCRGAPRRAERSVRGGRGCAAGRCRRRPPRLQLLARELDAAATRTRDRFAKPVIERLAPYLQLMLPQARLVLGDDLAPHALERGATVEDFARLSGGTQEQLALLVRLAFARLLADTGSPAPLILDDAVSRRRRSHHAPVRGPAARGAKPSGAGAHLPRARLRGAWRPSHRACARGKTRAPPPKAISQQTKTPGALSKPGVESRAKLLVPRLS